MFNIEFISKKTVIKYNEPSMYGRITLGDFSEIFISPIGYWSVQKFQQHWHESAERLLNGYDTTAFFTTMYDPATAQLVQLWPMWREGTEVRVHNQLLIFEDLKETFDPAEPYRLYLHKDELDDDKDEDDPDQPISTWNLSLDDLRDFVNRAIAE